MKKFKISSIKSLIVMYLIFLASVLGSFIAIKYVTLRRTEEMLTENAQSQLNLLDNKLQADLTGVQLRTWELLDNETLINYTMDQSLAKDITSKIRIEGEIKKLLKENVGASSTIGTLDCFWLSDSKRISSAYIEPGTKLQDLPYLEKAPYESGWHLIKDKGLFYMAMAPFIAGRNRRQNFDFLVNVKVKSDYLYNVLNFFEDNDYLNVMLLSKSGDAYGTGKQPKEVLKTIRGMNLEESVYRYKLYSEDGKYRILMQRNPLSGLWSVSYFNIKKALKQYRQVSDLTNILLWMLLAMEILVTFCFYRKFYTNFELMAANFKNVEEGDFSVRITPDPERPKEFAFMFRQFNKMLNNTEELIDQLKTEMRLRENAEFRQLQAQINPHFLYNNLLFIMSMAKTSPDAVISMTEHLSAYYRYMTKQYAFEVDLEQECQLAEHYLIIMRLRKDINYRISLPEKLKHQPFITLILQPLVENSIQHGIEKRSGANRVEVRVTDSSKGFSIQVIDDGPGITQEKRELLEYSLNQSKPENQGSIGLWNVNHRLINRYGPGSKLRFADNEFGGLTVLSFIPKGAKENESLISG